MAARFDKFLGRVRDWASKASDISDSGAAGRDILRMATLEEIQASVSGGAAAAVSAPKTLAAADRGCLQQTITTKAFTVTSSTLLAGWHVPIDGPCTFVSGTGSPTITDRRESGATYPFCVVSATPSDYVVNGSKL